jgi:hypothetical protein
VGLLASGARGMQRAHKIYTKLIEWLWNLLVLVLPFTSVPIIAKFSGSSNVAPASGIFLFVLLVIWFIPHIFKRGKIPLHTNPLIVFFLFAIFTTAASFFLYAPPYKSNTIISSAIKGTVTLIIGVGFFLIVSTILRDKKIFQRTLQMINWGGVAFLIWCAIQFGVWVIFKDNSGWLENIQAIISSGRLYSYRVTGFALEPSWLAHTLNIVYLPYWFAATVEKTSAHKFRFHKITFENILLIGGVVTLLLTFSRVGWAAFLLMLLYVFIRININFTKWILKKASAGKPLSRTKRIGLMTLISIGLIIVYLGIIIGITFFASKVDIRMAELFNFSSKADNPLLRYANSLKFGERIVYWLSGWKIFNDYPIIGVGLGNAGFYMPSRIAPFGWSMVEVQRLVYQSPALLNIKSLWFRLPAETGIIGLVLFITWLYLIFRSARVLQKQSDPFYRNIGLMGIFMLIGLVLEGISIDSFAMPYLWVTAGIVTAASVLIFKESKNKRKIKKV